MYRWLRLSSSDSSSVILDLQAFNGRSKTGVGSYGLFLMIFPWFLRWFIETGSTVEVIDLTTESAAVRLLSSCRMLLELFDLTLLCFQYLQIRALRCSFLQSSYKLFIHLYDII